MPLLALPEPYDFELSTARYRAYGPDLANLWHDGGLHRVVGGREVRITEAPGGVDVEPLDDETAAGRPQAARRRVRPGRVLRLRRRPTLFSARSPSELRGLRPPLAVEPFETIVTSVTAQQVSLYAAFAIRNRLIERFGERAEHAYAFPTRERLALAEPDEIAAVGFSRRKAEYVIGLARASSTCSAWPSSPTRRSRRRSRRCPGSASGRPTGSSPATSRAPGPGLRETSPCARRSSVSAATAAR